MYFQWFIGFLNWLSLFCVMAKRADSITQIRQIPSNPHTSCRKGRRWWWHPWGRRGRHCRSNPTNAHHSRQMIVIAPLIAVRPFNASILVANTKLLLLMIVALAGSWPWRWLSWRRWRRHCQRFSATIFAAVKLN